MPREFREYREIDEEEDERNDPERRALRPQMSEAEVWDRCLAEARRDLEEHPPTEEERRQRDALLAELDAESNLESLAGAPMEPTTPSKVALSEDEQVQLDAKMAELLALSDEELPLSLEAQEAHSADSRRSLVLGDSDQIRSHSSEVQERSEAVAAEVHAEEAQEGKEWELDFESARAGLQALVAVEAVGLRPTLEELATKGELAELGVDGVLTLLQERELLEGKSGEEVVLAVHAIEGLNAFGLLNQLERESFESLRTHLTRQLAPLEVERQEYPPPQIRTPKEEGWRWDSLAAEVALRVLDTLEVVGLQPTLEEMAERGTLAEQGAEGVLSHLNREGLLAGSRDEEGFEGMGRRLRWVVDSLELLERMGLLARLDRASWGEVREELVRLRAGTFSTPPEHSGSPKAESILRTQEKEGRVPSDWALAELLEPIRRWEDLFQEIVKDDVTRAMVIRFGWMAWKQLETSLARHPYLQDRSNFESRYRDALWFLVIKAAKEHDAMPDVPRQELAYCLGVSEETLRCWLNEKWKPLLFRSLRAHEKARRDYEKNLAPETHIHRIDDSSVYKIFQSFRDYPNQLTPDNLAFALSRLRDENPEAVIFAELRPYHQHGPQWLRTIASKIEAHRMEIEYRLNHALQDMDNVHHIGIINNIIYLWKRNTSTDNWLNLYANERLYFHTRTDKNHLTDDALRHLNLSNNMQISHLITQITDFRGVHPKQRTIADINCWRPYMKGETLHFLLDSTNLSLTDIQLHHIGTGTKNQGRILNPKFPPIEPLRTLLLASMLSDGHLTKNRFATYSETDSARLKQVRALFRQLGDIELEEIHDKQGTPTIYIPVVIGRLLERWGLPIGDKAIRNVGLPPTITEGPAFVKQAYLQELAPEDGSFYIRSVQFVFSVSRAVVLDAGEKSEKYEFMSKLSSIEIGIIHQFGQYETLKFPNKHVECISLSWSRLEDLVKSEDNKVALAAQKLKVVIKRNPCRLLEDEVRICQSLRIRFNLQPTRIVAYEGSGRVSVIWKGATRTIDDAIRLVLLAPPNDQRKRARVWKVLINRAEQTERIASTLLKAGFKSTFLLDWKRRRD